MTGLPSSCPDLRRPSPARPWVFLLAALVVAFGVYANTFANGWTYDDTPVILQNPDIQSFAGFLANQQPGRPLRELSLMFDRALFGMQPAGWHVQQIFWHGLNGFLVGALLLRLGGGLTAAVLAALVFLVHPLQVEVVAQLSHRKDSLALAFALLAMHAYVTAGGAAAWRRRAGWLLLSGTLFAAGCLAKESVVVLPLVMILYELLFVAREDRLLSRSPRLLLVLAGSGVLGGLAWYLGLGGRDRLLTLAGYQLMKYNYFDPVNEFSYLLILLKSWLFIFLRTLWPADLALEYVYPLPSSVADLWVLGALAMLTAWAAALYFSWKRHPVYAFALGWVACLWLPVANLWPTSAYFAADRYLYAPFAGVAILCGLGAAALARRRQLPALIGAGLLLVALCVLTWRQNAVWKDQLSLWRQAARVSPQSSVALNNYGVQLFRLGQRREGLALIERAAQNPYYYEANANAAQIYQSMGLPDKADYFRRRAGDPHAGQKFRFW